ncbi:hypothetical protein [Fulvivirga ligni]|uniref:hypothetical protein n=1 Tax=Fulvivirga ligni TaxID=2904246 RepID=UPI001F2A6200|nr:hypothetical protein [Fulvivirga ligni]UII19737.1 hypothetical protein LVD16_17995 [Fulvivirga ligni]
MNNGLVPEEMLMNQLNLLSLEEEKLNKLYSVKKNKSAIQLQLEDIRMRKDRLYRLCAIMGVKRTHTPVSELDGTARFGSSLIN